MSCHRERTAVARRGSDGRSTAGHAPLPETGVDRRPRSRPGHSVCDVDRGAAGGGRDADDDRAAVLIAVDHRHCSYRRDVVARQPARCVPVEPAGLALARRLGGGHGGAGGKAGHRLWQIGGAAGSGNRR